MTKTVRDRGDEGIERVLAEIEANAGSGRPFRPEARSPGQLSRALLPWSIRREHQWTYPMAMLQAEARRRAGLSVREIDVQRLSEFRESLASADLVVDYDPDLDGGFHYVPRRPGIDLDLIREPDGSPWEGWGDVAGNPETGLRNP